MTFHEQAPGNHEQDQLPVHPIIVETLVMQTKLYDQFDRGAITEDEQETAFLVQRENLTQRAEEMGIMGADVTLSGDSLLYPRATRPDAHEINFKRRPMELTGDEKAFDQPPSCKGTFAGIKSRRDEEGKLHFTVRVMPHPMISDDNGDWSPTASAFADNARLEFFDDARDQQIERALGIIKSRNPRTFVDKSIQEMDQYIRTIMPGRFPLRTDVLHALAQKADIIASDASFRADTLLSNATLDLLTERLWLPRRLGVTTSQHWRFSPELKHSAGTLLEETTHFKDISPELALNYRGNLARICFAATNLDMQNPDQHGVIIHIPLANVTRIRNEQ